MSYSIKPFLKNYTDKNGLSKIESKSFAFDLAVLVKFRNTNIKLKLKNEDVMKTINQMPAKNKKAKIIKKKVQNWINNDSENIEIDIR